MERHLEEGHDLQILAGGSRTLEKPDELGPNLLEVAARSLRRPQAGALDVIDAVLAGQPPRDMVAGGAVLGEPVVTKIENGDLARRPV